MTDKDRKKNLLLRVAKLNRFHISLKEVLKESVDLDEKNEKGKKTMENENENENEQNYYAVIPSYILNAKDITSDEKLLYALISSLANEKGYCYASNAYFAKRFGKSESSIKRWLSSLVLKNYVLSKVNYKLGSKQVESRHLNICNDLGPEMNPPGSKNEPTPGSKNELDTIKDNNNKKDINICNTEYMNAAIQEAKDDEIRKHQEYERKKREKFIKNLPTIPEIQKQIELKGYDVDAETFHRYYDADNWKGVKSWKRSLATWASNSKIKTQLKKEEPSVKDLFEMLRDE